MGMTKELNKQYAIIIICLLSWIYPCRCDDLATISSSMPSSQVKFATLELPRAAKTPRLFSKERGWYIAAYDLAKEIYMMRVDNYLLLYELKPSHSQVNIEYRATITLPKTGYCDPNFSIKESNSFLNIVYVNSTSSISQLNSGIIKFVEGEAMALLESVKSSEQFIDGKVLSSWHSNCPQGMNYIKNSPDGTQEAVCGIIENRMSLLIRSGLGKKNDQWDSIRNISNESGTGSKGIWIGPEKICVIWIDPYSVFDKTFVMCGILSKSENEKQKKIWKLDKIMKLHEGPVRHIDISKSGNQLSVGILELTSKNPRLVMYRSDLSANKFQLAGTMQLDVQEMPVDFSFSSSGKSIAGIVTTDEPGRFKVFEHSIQLNPTSLKELKEEQKNERETVKSKEKQGEWPGCNG